MNPHEPDPYGRHVHRLAPRTSSLRASACSGCEVLDACWENHHPACNMLRVVIIGHTEGRWNE